MATIRHIIRSNHRLSLPTGTSRGNIYRSRFLPSWTSSKPRSGCNHYHTSACLNVDTIKILMPALSPTMEEGTIQKWLISEGESFNAGDALCEIETDKATVTLDADDDGIVAKIIAPDGSKNVKITQLIALVVPPGEDYTQVEVPVDIGVEDSSATADGKDDVTTADQPHQSATLLPSVRHLVDEYNIDANLVEASGPHGLVKGDLLNYIEKHKLQPVPPPAAGGVQSPPVAPAAPYTPAVVPVVVPPVSTSPYIDIEVTNMRKAIARRLTLSKTTIPHAYASITSCIDSLNSLRKQLAETDDIKVSLNDLVIKIAAMALRRVAVVNGTWDDGAMRVNESVDISVAVATDRGLITPIVFNADRLDVLAIGSEVRSLARRAREGRLQPNEFVGGTFSISNLGMFGVREFSAVINPPQGAILAVGGGQTVPIGLDMEPSSVITVTLSYDARFIEVADAANFLGQFKAMVETPSRIGLL